MIVFNELPMEAVVIQYTERHAFILGNSRAEASDEENRVFVQ
jgi:hypothetical protein